MLGVNFGRVGFLTTMQSDELEPGLARVFAGDYRVLELPTLEVALNGETHTAVNDVGRRGRRRSGRMIELEWSIGGEGLGVQPCDGVICATPTGSTAYNLSNGGPVLVWGLDAMVRDVRRAALAARAPARRRPRHRPRGHEPARPTSTRSCSSTGTAGRRALRAGAQARMHSAPARSKLATLPEQTFFRRYGNVFGTA